MDLGTERYPHVGKIYMESIWLYVMIALCFLPHLFSYTSSMTLYIMILSITVFLFVFSGLTIRIERSGLTALWVLSTIVSVVSLLFSNRSRTAIFDVISLFCAMLIVVFYNRNLSIYHNGIKLIYHISFIFAIGILLQLLVPSLYRMIVGILPSGYAEAVLSGAGNLGRSRINGFATNSGSSASFIIAGIIAYVSLLGADYSLEGFNRIKKAVVITFLVLMVLFTGKRGPFIFLLLSLSARYLIPSRGNAKIKRFAIIFLTIVLSIIIITLFSPYLSGIQVIGVFFRTFAGLIAGADVSSSRFGLYEWAWRLFKENPLLGIGWGNFRFTTVGNVTRNSALDAHNIYLQLLCETGIIGSSIFFILFFWFWKKTKDALIQAFAENDIRKPLISFSFTYQTYFLLYGLTGNPLYDQHFQILYAIACAILLAYLRKRRTAVNQ